MGCVSSKLFAKEIRRQNVEKNRAFFTHHVVSLTSSTYGVLNLEKKKQILLENEIVKKWEEGEERRSAGRASQVKEQSPEIINAWELMEGLEEEMKKSPKSIALGDEYSGRSPFKKLNRFGGSPMKLKKNGGKENTPKTAVKECNDLKKQSPRIWSIRSDSVVTPVSRRRSLGPLFDPELVASFEKELSEEEENLRNTKKMISVSDKKLKKSRDSSAILESYKRKCPYGGENGVVLYTTTLRGIRKTFEECSVARSMIESKNVQMYERDVSMHAGFKDELRTLMGCKNVKVPLLFVKGRLIGGANEILKLEEEGKLDILLEGIPPATPGCRSCGGFRFLMCVECNGSCKVLGEDRMKRVKCGKCNENGLIQCPSCC